jgi:hypothetical protein
MSYIKTINWKLLALTGCLASLLFEVAASEMPTLMFSPSERLAIQQMRQAVDGAEKQQKTIRHAGIIQRQDGKNVVWLNDQVSNQGDAMHPITKGTSVVLDGQELRVGDQLDKVNGIRRSLVPEDAIQKKTLK